MGKNSLSLYDICQDCGTKCCIEPGPPIVFTREIKRIKSYLETNRLKNYLQEIEGKNHFIIPRDEKGCPYLNNGMCEIQEVKPVDCQIYPMNPIEVDKRIELSVSESCPAKHLLNPAYERGALELFAKLSNREKKAMAELARVEGYILREKPSSFGLELIMDLWGCNPNILSSREELIRYNKEIVKAINMKAVGDPIIPKEFGKGILYGYSSCQFIQTSSIITHIAKKMLEAHINIFSCKYFDPKKATEFTKDFFKARKMKSKVMKR